MDQDTQFMSCMRTVSNVLLNLARDAAFDCWVPMANGMEGGYSKRWIRGPVSTKTGGESQTPIEKANHTTIGHEIQTKQFQPRSTLNIKTTEDLQGVENSHIPNTCKSRTPCY
ncbi:hypothetical protein NC652_012682 [Populus alba x Populus x berolinensis]|nr:hypothetical protein NC652_012682 [Populus alba x Populus x berolinensis]